MTPVLAKIDSMTDAIKKIKSLNETDVHEAVSFLCSSPSASPDKMVLLLGLLKSPRMPFLNSADIAIDYIVNYGHTDDTYELQAIFDTTKYEDLAIRIGRRLEVGASAPGLYVANRGPRDDLGLCIMYLTSLYEDSSSGDKKEALDKLKAKITSPEDKARMLKILSTNTLTDDMLDESGRKEVTFRNCQNELKEDLVGEVPLSTEAITKMISKSVNGWEILTRWLNALDKFGGDKSKRQLAMSAAKSLFTRSVKGMMAMGRESSLRVSGDVLKLSKELSSETAKFFTSDVVEDVIKANPVMGAELRVILSSGDEMFKHFVQNPTPYLDRITNFLLDPNSSGIKNFEQRAIYELLPKIYSQLDQGVIDAIWERGNEAIKLAILQSIGSRWPSNRLMEIYREGSQQIKAAISKLLAAKKQSFLIPSMDGEM